MIEHVDVPYLSGKTVFFRFWDPVQEKRFDFADNTWQASPVNEKLVATEHTDMGDADESVYQAEIELNLLYSGSGTRSVIVQALDDLATDVILSWGTINIVGGAAVVPISADAAKLEAINEMLEAINEYRVSALDTGGISMAAQAEIVLDREDARIQEEGWYENTEPEAELTPDGDDKVAIATTVLRIDTRDDSETLNVSVREGYLYDLNDETDAFDETTLYVTIVRQLAFSNLSLQLRRLIVAQAKLTFHTSMVGNVKIVTMLEADLMRARDKAAKADTDKADHNIISTDLGAQILGAANIPHPGR